MSNLSGRISKKGSYPAGMRKIFLFRVTDGSWLPEDGAAYLIEDYPELYAFIGDTYNTGVAQAGIEFQVPNTPSDNPSMIYHIKT